MTHIFPDRKAVANLKYNLRIFQKCIAAIPEQDKAEVNRLIDELIGQVDRVHQTDPDGNVLRDD